MLVPLRNPKRTRAVAAPTSASATRRTTPTAPQAPSVPRNEVEYLQAHYTPGKCLMCSRDIPGQSKYVAVKLYCSSTCTAKFDKYRRKATGLCRCGARLDGKSVIRCNRCLAKHREDSKRVRENRAKRGVCKRCCSPQHKTCDSISARF